MNAAYSWRPAGARTLLTLLLAALLAQAGCAFSDGDPFGQLAAELSIVRDLPESRTDDSGRLITASDYALAVDSLTVQIDVVDFRLAGLGTAEAAFDPASPPEGYSLCHNGHCHHDSGRLVDYETIAAELGSSTASSSLAMFPGERQLDGLVEQVTLDCDGRCFVDQGDLRAVEVTVDSIVVTGTVFDRRTGDARRLPEAGVALDETFSIEQAMTVTVSADFRRDTPIGARVQLTLSVPPHLFDDIDWSIPLDAAARDSVASALLEHGALTATVTRYESVLP